MGNEALAVLDTCSLAQARWAIQQGEIGPSAGKSLLAHVTSLLLSPVPPVVPQFMPLPAGNCSPEQGLRHELARRGLIQLCDVSPSERLEIQDITVKEVLAMDDPLTTFRNGIEAPHVKEWLNEAVETGVVDRHASTWGTLCDPYLEPLLGSVKFADMQQENHLVFAFAAAVRGLGVVEWSLRHFPEAEISPSPVKQVFLGLGEECEICSRPWCTAWVTQLLQAQAGKERLAKWLNGLSNRDVLTESGQDSDWQLRRVRIASGHIMLWRNTGALLTKAHF